MQQLLHVSNNESFVLWRLNNAKVQIEKFPIFFLCHFTINDFILQNGKKAIMWMQLTHTENDPFHYSLNIKIVYTFRSFSG